MSIKKTQYENLIYVTIVISIILVVVLSFVNILTYPYVKDIRLLKKEDELADISSQILKVSFSRPMKQNNVIIDSTPKVATTYRWVGSNLFLIFDETLQTNTEYQIRISADFEDNFGRNINQKVEYSFKTKNQLFSFKKRSDGKEHIYVGDTATMMTRKIFSEDLINYYSPSKKAISVVSRPKGEFDKLTILDLNGKILFEQKFENTIIPNLAIAPNAERLIFTTQTAIISEGMVIPKSKSRVYIMDLSTFEYYELRLNELAPEVLDIRFVNDSRSIIYRATDGFYYISNVDGKSNNTILGRFTSFGGFNNSQSKAVFTTFEPLQTYSSFPFIQVFKSNREILNVTNAERYVTNPVFLNDDEIVFSSVYKEFEGTRGLMEILKIDEQGNIVKLFKIENKSIEMPKVSNDSRFISFEIYSQEALLDYKNQRNFINETKPNKADIKIYELKNKLQMGYLSNSTDFYWFI